MALINLEKETCDEKYEQEDGVKSDGKCYENQKHDHQLSAIAATTIATAVPAAVTTSPNAIAATTITRGGGCIRR